MHANQIPGGLLLLREWDACEQTEPRGYVCLDGSGDDKDYQVILYNLLLFFIISYFSLTSCSIIYFFQTEYDAFSQSLT